MQARAITRIEIDQSARDEVPVVLEVEGLARPQRERVVGLARRGLEVVFREPRRRSERGRRGVERQQVAPRARFGRERRIALAEQANLAGVEQRPAAKGACGVELEKHVAAFEILALAELERIARLP